MPDAVQLPPAVSLVALPDELQRHIFKQACNPLEPCIAVYLSGANHELWALTHEDRQQLRADHEVAVALCRRMGTSCKALREARRLTRLNFGLRATDLALLGTLGSVLPALESLHLCEKSAGPDAVQRLAERLRTGALSAVTILQFDYVYLGGMHVGDAGASALAAALGRGALPRLMHLTLYNAAIGDSGLAALAPALRRLPALETLDLGRNLFGDDGLTTLVAPAPPAVTSPTPTGVLTKLRVLNLCYTQVLDAGCVTLTSALDNGALPALKSLYLYGIPASTSARCAVHAALEMPVVLPRPILGGGYMGRAGWRRTWA